MTSAGAVEVPMAKSQQAKTYALDLEATPPLEAVSADSVSKALALLVDNEAKLLAAYDVRQASADTRITGLATASVALLTLTLSLSKAFSPNPARLQVVASRFSPPCHARPRPEACQKLRRNGAHLIGRATPTDPVGSLLRARAT